MSATTPSFQPWRAATLALFCKVVDNFGDIGICWRLSRQLSREHGIAVTLWVDDLRSFQRICPEVDLAQDIQHVQDITVRHWRDQNDRFNTADIADVVIEFFGCDIPPAYIETMSRCLPRPVWLNLEGLTAEDWVEGCHTLPSPHPRLPLTKHFFFPGFTARTGGLQHEAGLDERRHDFLHDTSAAAAFLAQFGVTPTEMHALKVSLFCYPHAPVTALFSLWQQADVPILCLVPEGVAKEAIATFLGQAPVAGTAATRGTLTVRVLPFVPQPDYDRLLWSCDVNFVRGEDSFVRAQWAGKPFIWHIYPQDENLHLVKLNAFLETCTAINAGAKAAMLAWNDAAAPGIDITSVWPVFAKGLDELAALSPGWRKALTANGDLTCNLLKFAETVRQSRPNQPKNGLK